MKVLFLVFFLSGIVAALLHCRRRREKKIIQWPQVKARVQPGSLVFCRTGWLPVGGEQGWRISSVMFEYEIDGCTHRGRNLLPVNWTIRESERERVRRELETFAVAFCNPTDSAEAFLDIPDRWQRGSISWVTVGLIAAVLMTGLLALMLLSNRV